MDNDVIYIEKSLNRRVIRRGVSSVYTQDSKVKAIGKAFDKGWILKQQCYDSDTVTLLFPYL